MGSLMSTEPRASKFLADLGDCWVMVQELSAQVLAGATMSTVKGAAVSRSTPSIRR